MPADQVEDPWKWVEQKIEEQYKVHLERQENHAQYARARATAMQIMDRRQERNDELVSRRYEMASRAGIDNAALPDESVLGQASLRSPELDAPRRPRAPMRYDHSNSRARSNSRERDRSRSRSRSRSDNEREIESLERQLRAARDRSRDFRQHRERNVSRDRE